MDLARKESEWSQRYQDLQTQTLSAQNSEEALQKKLLKYKKEVFKLRASIATIEDSHKARWKELESILKSSNLNSVSSSSPVSKSLPNSPPLFVAPASRSAHILSGKLQKWFEQCQGAQTTDTVDRSLRSNRHSRYDRDRSANNDSEELYNATPTPPTPKCGGPPLPASGMSAFGRSQFGAECDNDLQEVDLFSGGLGQEPDERAADQAVEPTVQNNSKQHSSCAHSVALEAEGNSQQGTTNSNTSPKLGTAITNSSIASPRPPSTASPQPVLSSSALSSAATSATAAGESVPAGTLVCGNIGQAADETGQQAAEQDNMPGDMSSPEDNQSPSEPFSPAVVGFPPQTHSTPQVERIATKSSASNVLANENIPEMSKSVQPAAVADGNRSEGGARQTDQIDDEVIDLTDESARRARQLPPAQNARSWQHNGRQDGQNRAVTSRTVANVSSRPTSTCKSSKRRNFSASKASEGSEGSEGSDEGWTAKLPSSSLASSTTQSPKHTRRTTSTHNYALSRSRSSVAGARRTTTNLIHDPKTKPTRPILRLQGSPTNVLSNAHPLNSMHNCNTDTHSSHQHQQTNHLSSNRAYSPNQELRQRNGRQRQRGSSFLPGSRLENNGNGPNTQDSDEENQPVLHKRQKFSRVSMSRYPNSDNEVVDVSELNSDASSDSPPPPPLGRHPSAKPNSMSFMSSMSSRQAGVDPTVRTKRTHPHSDRSHRHKSDSRIQQKHHHNEHQHQSESHSHHHHHSNDSSSNHNHTNNRNSVWGSHNPRVDPFVATERHKDVRETMKGVACSQCDDWYDAVQAYAPDGDREAMCNHVSRHRFHFTPPKTPPGYWDVCTPMSPLTASAAPSKVSSLQ
mmetsp:Transcript_37440/g.73656  ORF Transcript_37440/g.73656 Transcript_37440/m.73656 type:complete len:856 (-) Transcript_37440:458-3025(-)